MPPYLFVILLLKIGILKMKKSGSFISIHDHRYSYDGRLYSLYEIGCKLSSLQLRKITESLRAQGLPIESLEFYEYGQSDTLRHLFVKWINQNELIPYFQLDKDVWGSIVKGILNYIEPLSSDNTPK